MAIVVKLKNKNTSGKSYEMTSDDNTIHFDKVGHGTYQVEVINNGVSRYIEDLVVDGAENITVQGQTHIFINDSELLENSNFGSNSLNGWKYMYGNAVNSEGKLEITSTEINYSSRLEKTYENLEVGKTYTLTVRAKLSENSSQIAFRKFVGANIEDKDFSITGREESYSVTFIPDEKDVKVRLYVINVPVNEKMFMYWEQLEKGSIATDWTPAPEDMVTSSELEEIKKAIRALGGTI